MMLVMCVSWAFATFFFQCMCRCLGPQGSCGQIPLPQKLQCSAFSHALSPGPSDQGPSKACPTHAYLLDPRVQKSEEEREFYELEPLASRSCVAPEKTRHEETYLCAELLGSPVGGWECPGMQPALGSMACAPGLTPVPPCSHPAPSHTPHTPSPSTSSVVACTLTNSSLAAHTPAGRGVTAPAATVPLSQVALPRSRMGWYLCRPHTWSLRASCTISHTRTPTPVPACRAVGSHREHTPRLGTATSTRHWACRPQSTQARLAQVAYWARTPGWPGSHHWPAGLLALHGQHTSMLRVTKGVSTETGTWDSGRAGPGAEAESPVCSIRMTVRRGEQHRACHRLAQSQA